MNHGLTSRLRDLLGVASTPAPSTGRRPVDARQLALVLGGEVRDFEGGPCLVVERRYAPDTLYGALRIGASADAARRAVASWHVLAGTRQEAESVVPSPLFFDLETTGLAGGAGTYAFLVGCAAFEGDALRTQQFFLTAYGNERPLLAAVAAWMRQAGLLVSFNGRAFDAPLLETRYLFHRTAVPFAGRPHLDLLPVARRLWNRGNGCSLRVIEDAVAGVERKGDVPGMEIPARYVHYARTGDAGPLVPVFEHNRLDLLSLAMLTARASELVAQGPEAARDARECLGLGRLYERAGLYERALASYARAASGSAAGESPASVRVEALSRLALGLRRAGRHQEAVDAWLGILEIAPQDEGPGGEAARALAVHHEHRSKDLRAARAFAVRAVRVAASEGHRVAASRRLARLDRKLGTKRGRESFPLPMTGKKTPDPFSSC